MPDSTYNNGAAVKTDGNDPRLTDMQKEKRPRRMKPAPKRALSGFMLMCVLVVILCSSAENAPGIVTEFDDFVLRTDQPLQIQNEKSETQPLFMFYPHQTAGMAMSAVNAAWSRDGSACTAEAFSLFCKDAEAAIRAQYEAGGRKLTGYESGEAAEAEIWGRTVLMCDTVLNISFNETETILFQRVIRVGGNFGTYLFSLSAWSPELLEEAAQILIKALEWK